MQAQPPYKMAIDTFGLLLEEAQMASRVSSSLLGRIKAEWLGSDRKSRQGLLGGMGERAEPSSQPPACSRGHHEPWLRGGDGTLTARIPRVPQGWQCQQRGHDAGAQHRKGAPSMPR